MSTFAIRITRPLAIFLFIQTRQSCLTLSTNICIYTSLYMCVCVKLQSEVRSCSQCYLHCTVSHSYARIAVSKQQLQQRQTKEVKHPCQHVRLLVCPYAQQHIHIHMLQQSVSCFCRILIRRICLVAQF